MRRRPLLATIGSATTLGIAGCSEETDKDATSDQTDDSGNGDESDEDEARPLRTVEPGDSIQDAVDDIEAGGIVEVQDGTYEQSVTVEKELSLVAPDGAILDGVDVDGSAIAIAESGVEVEGFEVSRYSADAIRTESRVNEVTITDVELFDNSAAGINVSGDAIQLSDILAEDNDGPSVRVLASSNGDVTIRDAEINRCGNGVSVLGGESVDIARIEALQNEGDGIRVEGEDVRGQTVTITDTSIIEQGDGDGIAIQGTNGTDEITVSNTDVIDNSDFGLDLSGDIVEVTGVEATGNGAADAGISITSSADGEVTVRDTTVERTEYYSSYSTTVPGRGIQITDGETVTVENVTLLQNHDDQLRITGPNVRGQTVDISDSVVEANEDGNGIYVGGTNGTDEVTVANTRAVDNRYSGLDLTGDVVDVTGVEAVGNGYATAGISITSSADGEVTVRDTRVERTDNYSSYMREVAGRGIQITDGAAVTVEKVTLRENYGDQLRITGPNVRGQTVTVTDSAFEASEDGDGIDVEGTNGNDAHTIRNVDARDNDDYGIRLGAETVVIEDTSANGNGAGRLRLTAIDRADATIRNSF